MSGMVSRSMSLAPRRAILRRTRCGSIGITCGSCASSRTRRLEIALPAFAQGRVQRPMTFEDFAAVRNVGDPQVSPDGQWILYSVRTTDVNANKRTTVTRVQPVTGGAARQFPDASTSALEARWSPDG